MTGTDHTDDRSPGEPTSESRAVADGAGPRGIDPGTVFLVGAGPGDPELLTLKAARLLESADVVCYDSLVGDQVVEEFPAADAEVIDVGKRPDTGRRWSQDEINRLLADEALAGNRVVRLKGGDPTVFGRGGEEAEYLAEYDVPVEFVPGVTSPVAAPSSVGIPLTHRDHASSLTVVTGYEDPTKDESALDWDAIAASLQAGGTLVILMGVGRLPDNVAALRARDVPADTPVAVVERATLPDSTVTEGTLGTIVKRAKAAGVEPPATVVVGDVVDVRDTVTTGVQAASETPTPLRVDGGTPAPDGSGRAEDPTPESTDRHPSAEPPDP